MTVVNLHDRHISPTQRDLALRMEAGVSDRVGPVARMRRARRRWRTTMALSLLVGFFLGSMALWCFVLLFPGVVK
ncbi:MAG TPA: hypothetical protein PLZ36_13370 [Armatimonadota bacterium]|nr:hypothetical protein [Armatimonadota bacterium]